MAKKKLSKIHLLYDKRFGSMPWVIKFVEVYNPGDGVRWPELAVINYDNGKPAPNIWSKWRFKRDAVKDAIGQAKKYQPCSLKAHKKDGTIQWERSYGKGSESKRPG